MTYAEKEKLIRSDILSIENQVRHAFNQGYDLGYKHGIEKQLKTGHWIHTDECDEEWQYRCSKCNMPSRSNAHRYCSNCGSYMYGVEPQESEG